MIHENTNRHFNQMGGILVAKSYVSGHLAQLQMDQKI